MSDALETVLRLVAEGRITAEEAAPLIAALDEPARAEEPPGAPGAAAGSRPARQVRIEVTEGGRSVVNLRVPLTLGQAAISYVPGLDTAQVGRVKAALARGLTGTILEVADEDGDGVRIVLE
jgi:hypothetical protein